MIKAENSDISPIHDWPEADAYALAQSSQLVELIRDEITLAGGAIGFDRFMEMALYQPGLGYYSAGSRKFGITGDFTTAPETSSLFSICLARQCEQIFQVEGVSTLLELGAGTGIMACDILDELGRRQALPSQYLILETSADLRQRQQQLLQQRHPKLLNRLVWLDELPSVPIEGVILANEVLDALPVHRLRYRKHVAHELLVGTDDAGFIWRESEAGFMPEQMLQTYGELVGELPDGYVTEYNSMLSPFIETLSTTLGNGAILLTDYGYPRREYYHPQRTQGTLACYYRHRQHDNPFIQIGLQDITASIDFTQVAEAAHASGLEIYGFDTQAGFLVSSGLEKIISELGAGSDQAMLRYSQQAGKLILPGEMGETFKVMAVGKNIRVPLMGFSFGSHLHRL